MPKRAAAVLLFGSTFELYRIQESKQFCVVKKECLFPPAEELCP